VVVAARIAVRGVICLLGRVIAPAGVIAGILVAGTAGIVGIVITVILGRVIGAAAAVRGAGVIVLRIIRAAITGIIAVIITALKSLAVFLVIRRV
jgi:hypothetical protein